MRLAVATGMRLGEVVSARWDDVDVPGKLLHVAGETKTGTRAVPLGAEALDVLADLLARRQGSLVLRRSPFVFVDSAGADYTSMEARNRISKATKAVLKKAGVTGASYHTLRHTAASFMVQAGTSLYDVQVILGHSTPAMTQRYAHLAPDHLRGAVAALDRALGHVATPVATQDAAETASASSTASAAG
jgi:integrase